ncbi:MAG: hypothetical protein KDA32_08535 [Phycisphaerales bacterium]|nr:hypothetical protein [Phycisphaerales bacterium]
MKREAATAPRAPGSWAPFVAFGLIYTVVILIVVTIRAENSTYFRDFW